MNTDDTHKHIEDSGRASFETIQKQHAAVAESQNFRPLLDALGEPVFVVNRQRQIVFVNQAGLQHLRFPDVSKILGQRLGEALNCVHVKTAENGCGSTEFCEFCGAMDAILIGQKKKIARRECRIQRNGDGDLDILIKATRFELAEQTFTLLAVTDISDRKRRRALERIFFHDILNTAASIRLAVQSLKGEGPRAKLLELAADQLLDEIKSQKILLDAENRELSTDMRLLDSLEVIRNTVSAFGRVQDGIDRIRLADDAESVSFRSDRTLLRRVLRNAVQNALEATPDGQCVTIGCQRQQDYVQFWVHNPAYIPRKIQLQIFKRSFSTKGEDRGFGTYGMRLLSERYLDGQVHFTSTQTDGTKFILQYPLNQHGGPAAYN